jgi:hypothetical protein
MRVNIVNRFVRRLSGRGALDNVEAVLAARASIDAELDAFAARLVPPVPVATETPAAA